MKKTEYVAPVIKSSEAMTLEMLAAASVKSIGGDSGIQIGTGDTPETADGRSTGVWDDGAGGDEW